MPSLKAAVSTAQSQVTLQVIGHTDQPWYNTKGDTETTHQQDVGIMWDHFGGLATLEIFPDLFSAVLGPEPSWVTTNGE